MKTYSTCKVNPDKLTIYIDIDDVLLDSTHAVCQILNERYGTDKTQADIKDWRYRNINRNITAEEVEAVFDSDEFWNIVQLNSWFMHHLFYDDDRILEAFNWVLVTKGTQINLDKKYDFIMSEPLFADNKDKFGYIGLDAHEGKEMVHMMNGIQIDDHYGNLKDTDADLKILLKNGRDTAYNTNPHMTDNLENLYIANDMEDVVNILKFIAETGETFFDDLVTEM